MQAKQPMHRTQIQLTNAQMEALRLMALERKLSLAELIRRGVDRMIAEQEAVAPTRAELSRRAESVFGKFRSGKHDISVNHDHYLVEDEIASWKK